MSSNAHQISHELLREALEGALVAAVGSGPGDGEIGSTPWRTSAVLYALLGAHSVDPHGRCRSCRGLRTLPGRQRRICRVLAAAQFYLYQPEDMLLRLLANELHQRATPPPADAAPDPGRASGSISGDPDATDVLPRIG